MTYWDGHANDYYAGVYVQAAAGVAAVADPAVVDCALRLYVARDAFRIARPADLIGALDQVVPGARATLARFGLTS